MRCHWSELTFHNLPEWPALARWMIPTALFLVVVLSGYQYLLQPEMVKYRQLFEQEQQLKMKLEDRQKVITNLLAYQKQVKTLQHDIKKMTKLTEFRKRSIPELLDTMTHLATKNNVQLAGISPVPEQSLETQRELQLNIEIYGEYHNLLGFMADVMQMNRLSLVEEFLILSQTSPKASLKMELTLVFYRHYHQNDGQQQGEQGSDFIHSP